MRIGGARCRELFAKHGVAADAVSGGVADAMTSELEERRRTTQM